VGITALAIGTGGLFSRSAGGGKTQASRLKKCFIYHIWNQSGSWYRNQARSRTPGDRLALYHTRAKTAEVFFKRRPPEPPASVGCTQPCGPNRGPLASRRDSRLHHFRRAAGETRRPPALRHVLGSGPTTPFVAIEVLAVSLTAASSSVNFRYLPSVDVDGPSSAWI
jgi:hypothetical protein